MQATQEVVSRMPIITNSEFEEAVQAAKDAFPAWKRTPVPHRQRVMLKFQQLIRENMVRPGCLMLLICNKGRADYEWSLYAGRTGSKYHTGARENPC